jgi:hypothetical protein
VHVVVLTYVLLVAAAAVVWLLLEAMELSSSEHQLWLTLRDACI